MLLHDFNLADWVECDIFMVIPGGFTNCIWTFADLYVSGHLLHEGAMLVVLQICA